MSLFKEKTIKYNTLCNNNSKKNDIAYNSIDVKHIEIMNEFERKKEDLPNLKSKLDTLIIEINDLNDSEKIQEKINDLMLQKEKLLSKIEKLDKNDNETIDVPTKKTKQTKQTKKTKKVVKTMSQIIDLNENNGLSSKEKKTNKWNKDMFNMINIL